MNYINVETVCRTCLNEPSAYKNIYSGQDKLYKLNYAEIVGVVTGVQVYENDGLPEKICMRCVKSVSAAYHFKVQTQLADVALKQFLGISASNLKVEIDTPQSIPLKSEPLDQNEDIPMGFDDYDSDEPISQIKQRDSKNVPKLRTQYNNTCKICCKGFESLSQLTHHLKECVKSEATSETEDKQKVTLLNRSISVKITKVPKVEIKKNTPTKLCDLCKKTFANTDLLEEHYLSHKEMKFFNCNLCGKSFLHKFFIREHLRICDIHNKENGYTNEQLSNDAADENTVKTEPNANGDLKFSCLGLDKLLQQREKESARGFVRVCRLCSRLFFDHNDYNDHYNATHTKMCSAGKFGLNFKSKGTFKCNSCDKVYIAEKSFNKHQEICTSSDLYKCPVCSKRFSYEIGLNKHILKLHKGVSVSTEFIVGLKSKIPQHGKYECSICNKGFPMEELLKKHTSEHLPARPKRFECDVCKKSFNRKYNLLMHLKTHDPNKNSQSKGKFVCLYCGRLFTNSSNLVVHTRRHTGEKPYKCDLCSKGFPRSSDLQSHRRTHTGEKPNRCNICGKAFSRSTKLTRHLRVHTGHKPYLCSYCGRAFAQSNDLTLHIRRHTGDRPYACDVCGERFIQGTALRNHKKMLGHLTGVLIETPTPKSSLLLLSNEQLEKVNGNKIIEHATKELKREG